MSGGSVLTLWWLYDDVVVINDDDVDGDAVLVMTMVMSLLMMIDDDDVDAWETDTRRHHYLPWESLRPHITYFFLFANKLLMKIIWEWLPLFSLMGFSILNLVQMFIVTRL